ncbi:cytochrome c biogenesis protein CcdA, partial [Geobacillus sp. MMMUD3]|nr:cytochrome c biogenesis protein CcdA [Geobacillus sp. MMMUD3]
MNGIGADFAQAVLTGPLLLAAGAAALAGLVSFVSPCVLPLVPGYVGYVTGLSGSSLKDKETWRVVLGITLFVLGFTIVFVILGPGFSALGALFSQWQDIVIRILGVGVMIAGLVFMGAFGFLQRERRIQKKPKAGLWGAPVLGATFAIGWAPCVGPTLSAVLTMSLSFGSDGTLWRGAF